MYYKFNDIIKSLPKEKNKKSSLWVKLIIRRLSFIFTWIFINLSFSANMVSYLSILVTTAGSIFLMIDSSYYRIIGTVLINLWLILDCVDGNIARCKKKFSPFGSMVDAFGGYYTIAFSYLAIGIAAFHTTILFTSETRYIIIIIGALASICDLLVRLIYQKRLTTLIEVDGIRKSDDIITKFSFAWFKMRIDKEIGISGLFMPLLIVSNIFLIFDYVIIFYCMFNMLVLVFITVYFVYNTEKRIKGNEKI